MYTYIKGELVSLSKQIRNSTLKYSLLESRLQLELVTLFIYYFYRFAKCKMTNLFDALVVSYMLEYIMLYKIFTD